MIHAFPHRRLVLVGHSWGGPIVRVAASRLLAEGHPIDGIVLVDQADENASFYFLGSTNLRLKMLSSSILPLARMGLMRSMVKLALGRWHPSLLQSVLEASTSMGAAQTVGEEIRHFIAGLRQLRSHPVSLEATKISVISGQQRPHLGGKQRGLLIEAHRQTVSQHASARYVAADRSAHMIPMTEPELIAREVLLCLR